MAKPIHSMIRVLDEARSVDFYGRAFGMRVADRYDFDLKLVKDIALLVDRNEYKRQQAAPGLKVTSKAFGIGRRFPIAQRFSE